MEGIPARIPLQLPIEFRLGTSPSCAGISVIYPENGSTITDAAIYQNRQVVDPVGDQSASASQVDRNLKELGLTLVNLKFVRTSDVVPIVVASTADAKVFTATTQNPMAVLIGSAYHAAYVEIVDSDGASIEAGGYVTDAGSGLRWILGPTSTRISDSSVIVTCCEIYDRCCPLDGSQCHRDMRVLVRVHPDCHRPPHHVASPHRSGRPAWTGLCCRPASFYQVTGQSNDATAGDRSDQGQIGPSAWLRVIPPPRRTPGHAPDGRRHPATLHSPVMRSSGGGTRTPDTRIMIPLL